MPDREPLIPLHGGYRNLKSYQLARLVYDVTVRFCDRFIDQRSRTYDQMVQAARSGAQNVAEGSRASGTSKKTELKLTNVARASLEELRLDYEDTLRQRGLALWEKEDPRRKYLVARRCATADDVARWVKEVAESEEKIQRDRPCKRQDRPCFPGQPSNPQLPLNPSQSPNPGQSAFPNRSESASRPASSERSGSPSQPAFDALSIKSIESIKSIKSISSPKGPPSPKPLDSLYIETAANAALVLIGVASALLDRQIASQAKTFEKEGGFTERLYRTRQNRRRGE